MSTLAALALLHDSPLRAATVHASFLQTPEAVRDTIEVLTDAGCTKAAVAIFPRLVGRYYAEPFRFDLTKFPKPTNGFYSFSSPQKLIAALPHRLPETQHTFDFNCIDTIILLADGGLQTRLRPDEIVGPIMASIQTTNGEAVALVATPRDAFTASWQPWYREPTEALIPEAMRDDRICLVASLFRWHILPMSTSNENLGPQVLEVLRATWRQEKLHFPTKFEVVLIHNVDFRAHTICTCHAGLLFQRGGGYTYLEKSGGSGPFVRLDLAEASDLIPWLATVFKNYTDANFQRFATFNDQTIKNLNP